MTYVHESIKGRTCIWTLLIDWSLLTIFRLAYCSSLKTERNMCDRENRRRSHDEACQKFTGRPIKSRFNPIPCRKKSWLVHSPPCKFIRFRRSRIEIQSVFLMVIPSGDDVQHRALWGERTGRVFRCARWHSIKSETHANKWVIEQVGTCLFKSIPVEEGHCFHRPWTSFITYDQTWNESERRVNPARNYFGSRAG